MGRAADSDGVAALHAENARLIALLEAHGIDWRRKASSAPTQSTEVDPPRLTTAEKVTLFRRLFRGRTDVYPIRWESKTSGRSGYSPACANEWRPGICEKPRIKCADCGNRSLVPLSDSVIYDHLAGEHTVGVYPLLEDDSCHFLAVDFDDAEWRDDVRAFAQSCRELGVPVAVEISRSGQGAHAWIFFASRVSARDARRLGTAIISHTCARTRQLKLASYDRLFPNQDTMPSARAVALRAHGSAASAISLHCRCRRRRESEETACSSTTTYSRSPTNGRSWLRSVRCRRTTSSRRS